MGRRHPSTLLWLAAGLSFEFVVLTQLAWGVYPPFRAALNPALAAFGYFPAIIRAVLETTIVLLLLASRDVWRGWSGDAAQPASLRWRYVGANAAAAIALGATLLLLRGSHAVGLGEPAKLAVLSISVLLWFAFLVSILALIAPLETFTRRVRQRYFVLSASIVFFLLWELPRDFWSGILSAFFDAHANALLGPTLWLAAQFTSLVGLSSGVVSAAAGDPVFGSDQFKAQITWSCSGYEGVILIVFIVSILLATDAARPRLGKILLVYASAISFIFLLNGLRIALIVVIGSWWSAEIAATGFHSYIGWVNVIIATVMTRALMQYLEPSVGEKSKSATFDARLGGQNAYLLAPLAAIIGASIVGHLFSGRFYWLYPAQALVAAAVIYRVWPALRFKWEAPNIWSLLVGVAVFVAWIWLVPPDAQASASFARDLFSAPALAALIWILFRIVGAALIVPFAEELAFRGYLQPLATEFVMHSRLARLARPAGILIASAAFAAVHSDFVAGFVAGVGYGVLRSMSGNLTSPIAAHAITNSLLALYVLTTEFWSYW